MFYESIVGICVLVYLLWKFLLPGKQKHIQPIELVESYDVKTKQVDPTVGNSVNVVEKTQDDINFSVKESASRLKKEVYDIQKTIEVGHIKTTIAPLVGYQHHKNTERSLFEDGDKRESPPKERFAEFIEKTLCDNKIQSLIQNLSLDNDLFRFDKPGNECNKENEPELKPIIENSTISEKAVKLQNSIDEIADKIKLLNETKLNDYNDPRNGSLNGCSTIKAIESTEIPEQPIEIKTNDTHLLKRVQRQSGLPTGLNFGSLIGELKNKTKNASNGNLKPVFKKFDTNYDAVDDAKVLNQ